MIYFFYIKRKKYILISRKVYIFSKYFKMIILIKYLENRQNIEISNTHKRIGYIQDEILNKFSLMIYNIEYTKVVYQNGTIYLGNYHEDDNLDTSYIKYFDSILENHNINLENILYFEIEERHRDEKGNVIKKNKYIDNYNEFLIKKSEDEYNTYFENMVQQNNIVSRINYENPINIFESISLEPFIIPSTPIIFNRVFNIETNNIENNSNEINSNENEEVRNIRPALTSIENELISILMNQIANEIETNVNDEVEEENEIVEEENEIVEEENEIVEEENEIVEEENIFIHSSNEYRNENLPNLPTHVSQLFGIMNSPYNNPLFMNNISGLNMIGNNLFDLNGSFRFRYMFNDQIRNIFNGTLESNGSLMNDIKVTLTEEEYNNIETKKYYECCCNENEEQSLKICIICNDEFKENDIVKMTKCKHVLHDECLKPWLLKESKKCPVCRMELGVGKAHIEEESKEDDSTLEDVE